VEEGPQYRIGAFEVVGNRVFNSEDVRAFYPFGDVQPSLTERLRGVFRASEPRDVFDAAEWEAATQRLRTAYNNEGYIYASIRPIVQRTEVDGVPTVNLRWEIEERTPAIINRVEIVGNDYTTESCIRSRISVVPGDVFNQDRLIRSYQNLANLGFFEVPMPPPDTRPANDEGDVDIIFTVQERRTGNISFGASMGQGSGFGGFLGLDQPNLFGQCKRASLQWQFGRLMNDFTLSYTDPAIRGGRISGTTTAYHTRSRFLIEDLGRQQRTGGSVQLGFPLPRSLLSSVFVSYGLEAVKYEGGIFDRDTTIQQCDNCLRSTLGLSVTRDTRIDLPFPSAGVMQTASAQFNGGPLGGTSDYQRYTTEVRAYAPLGQLGATRPGSNPMRLVLGLTARAGMVHGDVGPFFVSQKFALGGVQFGEQLRGYEEFTVTPQGVLPGRGTTARRESFGSVFMTTTAEIGLKLNPSIYLNAFYDAGNVWNRPREFDPTRLVRGAGVGVALVTPLGPLGLDWAYGFDRVNELGQRAPQWQLHFKLGNIF
jgi:outer membrane protein insertion porin family